MKAPVKQGDIIFQWLLFWVIGIHGTIGSLGKAAGVRKKARRFYAQYFLIILHRDGGYGGYGDCGENSGLSHLF